MSSQFRFSRGIFVATLALFVAAPIVASAADAPKPANSGKGRYTKQELEVKASQTNLTKPDAPPPPKKQSGPTLTVDQFREQKTQEIQKIVDAQISKMRRLLTVTAEDDPQKPDFFFRLLDEFLAANHTDSSDADTGAPTEITPAAMPLQRP